MIMLDLIVALMYIKVTFYNFDEHFVYIINIFIILLSHLGAPRCETLYLQAYWEL